MSKHKCEIEAGQVLLWLADGIAVAVGLTFYIWDKDTKKAVFCRYMSQLSEKETKRHGDAVIDGTAELRQRGIGRAHAHKSISLEKSVMQLLDDKNTTGALSFDPDDDSSKMTATVTLDHGHVQLPFLVLAELPPGRLNTRGYIFGEKLRTAKHRPKIEKNKLPE